MKKYGSRCIRDRVPLRVTVGAAGEMDALCAALKKRTEDKIR